MSDGHEGDTPDVTAETKGDAPSTWAGGADDAGKTAITRPEDAPRLEPRPVYRPPVDDAAARVFGRPDDVAGSFAPEAARRSTPEVRTAAPDAVLAEAYGRPPGAVDTLQRDPDASSDAESEEPQAPADPWRDPEAGVVLGAPAATAAIPEQAPAPQLSAREVLFGGKVAPRALAVLGGVALLIGVLGGLVAAAITADRSSLTSQRVTLAQTGDDQMGSSNVAQVADAVLPAVVSIQVASGDQGSTGSGVVVDGDGYIVTNNHVISSAATAPDGATISVIFSDGTKTQAEIVGRDTKMDLAVLKVAADNLTVAELGRSGDVRVGDDVVAVGSPLGLSKTVTAGIVSALNRPMRLSGQGTDTNAVIDAVQTDASINHGNSGGALVDSEGRVIGINTAMLSETGGSVGLGFAIPIDDVAAISQALIRDGVMHHPDIGVNARTVVNDATSGAEVANVREGSPAANAGIVERDVIVRVGDRQVTSADELAVAINLQQIGEPTTVQLVREGRNVEVQVTPVSD